MAEKDSIVLKPSDSEGRNVPAAKEYRQPNYFGRLLDKSAKIKTISGSVIDCTIRGFNSYELLAEISKGEFILLPKHSILFISSDALKPKPRPEKAGGDIHAA
jgi:hypothetical protein